MPLWYNLLSIKRKENMMKPLIIVLIIISSLIIVLGLFLFFIYAKIFLMTKKAKKKGLSYDLPYFSKDYKDTILENAKKVESIPHIDVYVKSYDGLKLHGYYYHVSDDSPLEIDFHGYKGQAFRDFSGGALMAINSGFNLLLVEHRAHGYSEGHTISFGIKERRDVETWVNYANAYLLKNNKKIILTGISMGASTVLMASNIPMDNVKGIIADCPYSSPKEIILNTIKNMKINEKAFSPFVDMSAFIFGHFKMNDSTAIKSVKDAKYPILLIHGEKDSFVPYSMSEQIKSANENIEFYSFKDADHGLSYLVDTNRYMEIVNNFIDKILYKED